MLVRRLSMGNRYNSYRNGLEVSDIVFFKYKLDFFKMLSSKTYRALVLDRELLFAKPTRFGTRSFFKYKLMCLDSKKVFFEETKNIRTIKYLKGS